MSRRLLIQLVNSVAAVLCGGALTVIPYLPQMTSMPDPFGVRFESVFSFLEFPGFLVAYFGGHPPHDLSERLMTVSNIAIWSLTSFFILRRLSNRRTRPDGKVI
jgi:hypothetical protein